MSSQVLSITIGKKLPDVKIRMINAVGDRNKLNQNTTNNCRNMNARNPSSIRSDNRASGSNFRLVNVETMNKSARSLLNPTVAVRPANSGNRNLQKTKPAELRKIRREVILTNVRSSGGANSTGSAAGMKQTKNSASTDTVNSRISLLAKPKIRLEVCLNSAASTASKNTTASRLTASTTPSRLPVSKPAPSLSSTSHTLRSRLLPNASTGNNNVSQNTLSSRVWNRNLQPQAHLSKQTVSKTTSSNASTTHASSEISTQTNEAEILNNSLLVGDTRFITPSKNIIMEIEKQRLIEKNKQLLKATRKFEEHSRAQEQHLDNWNEFLERGFITKKKAKNKDYLEENKKLISSMDQILNRAIPKTESISNIKARIKHKEKELLSLFDNVHGNHNYL